MFIPIPCLTTFSFRDFKDLAIIWLGSLLRWLTFCIVAFMFCGALNSPALADEQVIDSWAIWGPGWGRGSLAANSPNYENHLRPQPGDTDFSTGNEAIYLYAWKLAKSEHGLLPFSTLLQPEISTSWDQWAGGRIYAHTYLYSPDFVQVNLKIESPVSVESWLNGIQPENNLLNLQQGWNHLLLKVHSPTEIGRQSTGLSEKDWWIRTSLSSPSHVAIENIQSVAFDPARKSPLIEHAPPLPLRYLSSIKDLKRKFPIFTKDQSVSLRYTLQVGYGWGKNSAPANIAPSPLLPFTGQPWVYSTTPPVFAEPYLQPTLVKYAQKDWDKSLPASVHFQIYSDWGSTVLDKVQGIQFNTSQQRSPQGRDLVAQTVIPLGKLPVGHYTLRADFLNRDGTLQAHDRDHEFSVIWGPVTPRLDASNRLLACVYPWLIENLDEALSHLHWLHTVGITRQHKLSLAWRSWGVHFQPNHTVVIKDASRVNRVLAEARRLNISVIGNLEMGWLDRDRYNEGSTPQSVEPKQPSQSQQSSAPQPPKILSLREPGGSRLPPYNTKEFAKVLHNYANAVVSYYQDRIHTWTGSNEIDLMTEPKTAEVAKMYADATKILYRALKKADPKATFVSPSLTSQSEFTKTLFKYGFGENVDIIDVHDHPPNAPQLSDPTLGGGQGGLVAIQDYLNQQQSKKKKAVWYGEISAPLAHSPNGVWGQAEAVVKQLAWGIKHPLVQSLSYLVMNNQPIFAETALGFNNRLGDPHPAVNAINVASHLLDGRRRLPDLQELPKDVQQLRVNAQDGRECLVLWSDREIPLQITILDNKVLHVNLFGRRQHLKSVHGKIRLTVNHTPQYLIGKFTD